MLNLTELFLILEIYLGMLKQSYYPLLVLIMYMNRNHRTIVVLMFSLLVIAWPKPIRRPWKLPSTAQCFVLPNINDCILIEFVLEQRSVKFIWSCLNMVWYGNDLFDI